MKPPGDYFVAGFGLALRRPHDIAIDVLSKGIRWTVLLVLLMVSLSATLAQIPVSETEAVLLRSGIDEIESLILVSSLVRHGGLVAAHLLVGGVLAAVAWILIEALTRGLLFGLAPSGGAAASNPSLRVLTAVLRHLIAGTATRLFLGAAAIIVGLVLLGPVLTGRGSQWTGTGTGVGWPLVATVALVGLVAFFLAIFDSLARLGALGLVGAALPEVIAVSGLTIAVTVTVWTAILAVLAEALSRGVHPLLVAGLIGTAATVSSLMFIARFRALGLMQQEFQRSE